MRVVRQILVGLGLIVLGVGGIVTMQGISLLGQTGQSMQVEAIIITILGGLLSLGGVILLVAGIRKRAPVASSAGAEA